MSRRRQPRRVELKVGDTGPAIRLSLTDPDQDDAPIDVSDPAAGVSLVVKTGGEDATIVATITCSKLAGYVQDDGTINTSPPYNTPGAGGLVQVDAWPTAVTSEARALFGWIRYTSAAGLIQTLKLPVPIVVNAY